MTWRVFSAGPYLEEAQQTASAGVKRAAAAESECVRLRAAAKEWAKKRAALSADAAASAAALSVGLGTY
jgi:hypothetical protein